MSKTGYPARSGSVPSRKAASRPVPGSADAASSACQRSRKTATGRKERASPSPTRKSPKPAPGISSTVQCPEQWDLDALRKRSLATNFVWHYPRAMRNVTITLDEEVAQWARIEAAKRETSVSRFVGEMLRDRMQSEESYEEARRQFFAIAPRPLRAAATALPSREELHDRAGLR
jgi:hypothetical protein